VTRARFPTPAYAVQVALAALATAAMAALALSRRRRRAIPAIAVVATLAAMAVEATAYRAPYGITIPAVFEVPSELLEALRRPLPPLGLPGRAVWAGTVGLFHRVETANGYSGFIDRRYGQATGWGQHGAWHPWTTATPVREGQNRVLDVLAVRWVVLPRYQADTLRSVRGVAGTPRFRVAAEAGEEVVLENLQALPRLYLASGVTRVAHQDEALALLARGAIDPARAPALEAASPALQGGPSPPARLRVLARAPAELRLRTASRRASLLVVADAFDPGWRALVDGVPSPVLRTNGFARGVLLPAGKHDVILVYRPATLARGGVVSAATALFFLAAILAPRFARRV
jgi:hypothetical protein